MIQAMRTSSASRFRILEVQLPPVKGNLRATARQMIQDTKNIKLSVDMELSKSPATRETLKMVTIFIRERKAQLAPRYRIRLRIGLIGTMHTACVGLGLSTAQAGKYQISSANPMKNSTHTGTMTPELWLLYLGTPMSTCSKMLKIAPTKRSYQS